MYLNYFVIFSSYCAFKPDKESFNFDFSCSSNSFVLLKLSTIFLFKSDISIV